MARKLIVFTPLLLFFHLFCCWCSSQTLFSLVPLPLSAASSSKVFCVCPLYLWQMKLSDALNKFWFILIQIEPLASFVYFYIWWLFTYLFASFHSFFLFHCIFLSWSGDVITVLFIKMHRMIDCFFHCFSLHYFARVSIQSFARLYLP